MLAAGYAWLASVGAIEISAGGAILDSDLQTYAQGMAGAANRQAFGRDPVLDAATAANSIPNLQRMLAELLAPAGAWAAGLLRAGALAIFLFYSGWYLLGRWLYRAPALAAMLALTCGITVWVGWGTFWGITHSDPVPRVFFAALMPYLLLAAFLALNRPWLRPPTMLACGLAIWVHGVSALNCGAMIFMAFLCIRAPGASCRAQLRNLALCLIAFLTPVLIFLWPALTQGTSFSQSDLDIFHALFNLRWREDYGRFGHRFLRFFSAANPAWPILCGSIAGYIVIWRKGTRRERLLCKTAPCFIAALLAIAGLCWLEGRYAPAFGRLPLGHELVRGLRFCVPIAWLLAIGGIGCLLGKTLRRIAVCAIALLIGLIGADRQQAAFEYAFAGLTGIRLPLCAEAAQEAERARQMEAIFSAIKAIVPADEAIYCPEDAMQVRYISNRALAHAFKDGYVHFYNKDTKKSALWLRLENKAAQAPDGFISAWRESGAEWLLCRAADKVSLPASSRIELDENGWLLVRKG